MPPTLLNNQQQPTTTTMTKIHFPALTTATTIIITIIMRRRRILKLVASLFRQQVQKHPQTLAIIFPVLSMPYPSLRRAIVANDGSSQNLIHLNGLKSLFAKRMPKMPKEYIARLVFAGTIALLRYTIETQYRRRNYRWNLLSALLRYEICRNCILRRQHQPES